MAATAPPKKTLPNQPLIHSVSYENDTSVPLRFDARVVGGVVLIITVSEPSETKQKIQTKTLPGKQQKASR